MGYDIGIRPDKGNISDFRKFLREHRFKEIKTSKKNRDLAYFYFFEPKDYLSITGLGATIRASEDSKSGIEIHFRSTYSASYYDVYIVNKALKEAKRQFGGYICGDYGKNRYIPLESKDDSTPLSRGLSFAHQSTISRINRVLFSIPDSIMKPLKRTGENDEFADYIESHDPTRHLYSALVPYAVSAVEYYFSKTFQVLLKYEPTCLKKVEDYSKKVDFKDVLLIVREEKPIEAIIADDYSFQNMKSINKAFNQWFNIDIKKLLYRKKKIDNGFLILDKKMEEIIEFRHGVIHRFEVDESLTKKDLITIFKTVKAITEIVSDYLEEKYSIEIERD